jgi:hypothetical protein
MNGKVVFVLLAVAGLLLAAAGLHAASDFVPIPGIDKYLTPANMEKLKAGEIVKENVVTKDAKGNDTGRGVALILIKAPKDKIMAALGDYPTYPAWMPNTKNTKVVSKQGDMVSVEFELSVLMNQITYTCIHKVDNAAGTVQWRMDDSKPKKNVSDSVGAWVIKPLGENESVVAYTVSVDTGMSVPKIIQDWMTNKSLKSVVKAVKSRVEGK